MEDPQTQTQTQIRFLNPWVLHLQKLGLELKCPFCLNLFNNPMLLPCNHIFCRSCVPESKFSGVSDCPICKVPYVDQDLREAPYMEHMVNIYRSLDASFSMHMLNSAKRSSKEPIDLCSPGNSISGVKTTLDRCSGFANPALKPSILEHNYQSKVMSFSQGRDLQPEQNVGVGLYMNQVELSPDSPPSSGASKGVEIDNRDQARNRDVAGKCTSNKSTKRAVDDIGAQALDKHHDSYCKKQKQTTPSLVELHHDNSPTMAMSLPASLSAGSANQLVVESASACASNFMCAFCQTSKITKGSGPMHHFSNTGKQISGNEAGRSNVVHLHQSCIEWTPQIYYEDDSTIRNVDKELARAGKLKCSSCGLKGAALGCFAKSCRRTYHAPCAYEIPDCRWDTKDFLMLCPAHASQKFPSERSKKSAAKKPSSAKIFSRDEPKKRDLCETDSWMVSPTGTQNWVLCASSLSADQKSMLVKFANLCGATVTRNWTPEVTHVIAATDANGACSRTLKVLMAILKGRWVLKTDWVKACMESKRPVDEEPYEINLDNHGCYDGPKTGRLRALSHAPMLFSGMTFYFSGDFLPSYQRDLGNLIVAGGGTVLESREQLQQLVTLGTTVILYNEDEATGPGVVSTVLERQVEAEMVAAETRSHVVPHTWLLGSIASNRLQSYV